MGPAPARQFGLFVIFVLSLAGCSDSGGLSTTDATSRGNPEIPIQLIAFADEAGIHLSQGSETASNVCGHVLVVPQTPLADEVASQRTPSGNQYQPDDLGQPIAPIPLLDVSRRQLGTWQGWVLREGQEVVGYQVGSPAGLFITAVNPLRCEVDLRLGASTLESGAPPMLEMIEDEEVLVLGEGPQGEEGRLTLIWSSRGTVWFMSGPSEDYPRDYLIENLTDHLIEYDVSTSSWIEVDP